jgi:hypothetical protein
MSRVGKLSGVPLHQVQPVGETECNAGRYITQFDRLKKIEFKRNNARRL